VQVGVQVQPDTVTVGEPFVVTVRVRAPVGAALRFPDGPDTTHVVQAIDPPDVATTGDTAAVDQTARYRVAAWDVGTRPIELGPVTLELDGEVRELALEPRTVFVRSVLPEDTAQRVPKPARAPWEFPRPWWLPWLVGLIVAAVVGLLLWWWWRRRQRRRLVPARLHADPYEDAEARFARVEALRLLEAGERGRHVTLMLDVLRDFLARRYPAASPANTSRELLVSLAGERTVPLDRLAALLHDGDLVKFARRALTEERARALGLESRALVRAVHEASEAEAAARAAAQSGGRGGPGPRGGPRGGPGARPTPAGAAGAAGGASGNGAWAPGERR
jgi:hypothetical protein